MKLQTQLNTCRLRSFSYCNPFLFLPHSHPVSLRLQSYCFRPFWAGISISKLLPLQELTQWTLIAVLNLDKKYTTLPHSHCLHDKGKDTLKWLLFSFFLVISSCCSAALQQSSIVVSDVKHVIFSFFMPLRSICSINNVRAPVYFHDRNWNSLCFTCQAPHAYGRGRSFWSNQLLFLLGFLFSVPSKLKISHSYCSLQVWALPEEDRWWSV